MLQKNYLTTKFMNSLISASANIARENQRCLYIFISSLEGSSIRQDKIGVYEP